MAEFTQNQVARILAMLQMYESGLAIPDLEIATSEGLTTSFIEVVQNGVSKRATPEMLASSLPVDGVYPDTPANRVTITREVGQLSPLFTYKDNVSLIDEIFKGCKPVLLDRDSRVDTLLSGKDIRKNDSGYPVDLTLWYKPAMLWIKGFWMRYEYDAITNAKLFHFSPFRVKGYKYMRSRFLPLFNGNTVTNSEDGSSKTFLCSTYDAYTTQSITLQNAHSYAKNLGSNYRAMADQDFEVYTYLFWLLEGTVNSQGVADIGIGITDVNYANWSNYNTADKGGQSSYGQFHKNGITASLTSHRGKVSHTVPDFPNGAITVTPNRFLWRENGIAGPYYIFTTGRLIIDNEVWQVDDLDDIAFSKTNDFYKLCSMQEIAPSSNAWQRILDMHQDTLVPSMIGGSDTTGMCDQWYGLTAPTAGSVYVPARLGYARSGAVCGLGLLASDRGAGYAYAIYGVSLACDDPSDTTPHGTIA